MLGEILPDLCLLAVVLAFLLSRGARLAAADRARVGSAVTLASATIELPLATPVHIEPGVPTVPDENAVLTLALALAPKARFPGRILLKLLRRHSTGRLRAAQRRGCGDRRALTSQAQRGGLALVLRSARRRALRDGRRFRREARVMHPVPLLWRLLLLLLRQTREGQPWPSLARLDCTSQLPRRSVLHILGELKKHGIIATRPRDFAAGKAGAT